MKHFAFILLSCLALMGQIAGPAAKSPSGNEYRLLVDLGGVDADTMIRFPRLDTGTNTALPGGLAQFYQQVKHMHIRAYRGSQTLNAVVYSELFPAGAETLKCTANVRGVTLSGMPIDSVKILDTGTPPSIDSVSIYVTD